MNEQIAAWELWYKEGLGKRESVSGVGSTLESTKAIRLALPGIFKRYQIQSILDLGCGDWNWMKLVDLSGIKYVGWDVVPAQIEANKLAFPDHRFVDCKRTSSLHRFEVGDAISDPVPKVDLILCRDLLFHLTNEQIGRVLENVRVSGSKRLLTTFFPQVVTNTDVRIGKWPPWRAINLCAYPFNLPPPVEVVEEGDSQACRGRIMGLFNVGSM